MTTLLKRFLAVVSGWFGRSDDLPLTPAHGWLLPVPVAMKVAVPRRD